MVANVMKLGWAVVALRLVEAGAEIIDKDKAQLLHFGMITETPETTPTLRLSDRGKRFLAEVDTISVRNDDTLFGYLNTQDAEERTQRKIVQNEMFGQPYAGVNLKLGTPYENIIAEKPIPLRDWKVSDTEMANKVMLVMGFSGAASKEPNADPMRDKIAKLLREYADSEILGAHKFARELQEDGQPTAYHITNTGNPQIDDIQRHPLTEADKRYGYVQTPLYPKHPDPLMPAVVNAVFAVTIAGEENGQD